MPLIYHVVLTNGEKVSVVLGNGDGSFQAPNYFSPDVYPVSAALGDLDKDGDLVLAVANGGGDNVLILLGNGDKLFTCH